MIALAQRIVRSCAFTRAVGRRLALARDSPIRTLIDKARGAAREGAAGGRGKWPSPRIESRLSGGCHGH